MKITKLETICLSRMHAPHEQWITAQYRTVKADCTIVVVHTNTDIKGIGEASSYGWPLNIRDWVDFLAPTLIGADPEDPAISPPPVGNNRGHDGAVAGIDCALWDIRGQAAGKSVNELITGTPVESVPLYASSGCRYDWRYNPEQLFQEAEEYIERGFGAMKFRIGTDWSWDGITVDRFLDHVRELVRVVDGRMKLALDGNCRLTPEESLPIARELDRLGFAWFEEPMPWSDVASYAELNRAVELPITGGESFATLAQMRPYLDAGAYDVVQPDARLQRNHGTVAHRQSGRGTWGQAVSTQLAQRAHGFGQRACSRLAAQQRLSGTVHDPGTVAMGLRGGASAHHGRQGCISHPRADSESNWPRASSNGTRTLKASIA